ncbi:MAG: NADH-quinone oxidoreductase subunit NuoK [Cyanobacteria bacterium P01_H01_bin.74]
MPDFITTIGLNHYIMLASLLFALGLLGVLTNRNVIRVLMSLELMMSAVSINLIAFNNFLHLSEGLAGHVLTIFILTVSAAEASVGLAIIIALYRAKSTADMNKFDLLKW